MFLSSKMKKEKPKRGQEGKARARTPQALIEALKKLDGSASGTAIAEYIEQKKLLDGPNIVTT